MFHWKGVRCSAGGSRRCSQGFSVFEFLISICVLGILVGLAVPAVQQFSTTNQLTAANNTIISGLNLARSTAISTGDDITICPSTDGASCSEDSWDNGWIVFNDEDADGAPDQAEILRVVAIEGQVSNSGFGEEITFTSDGTTGLGSGATITNCTARDNGSEACTDVVVSQFGMIQSHKYDSGSGEDEGS